jgi:hypothetical protein
MIGASSEVEPPRHGRAWRLLRVVLLIVTRAAARPAQIMVVLGHPAGPRPSTARQGRAQCREAYSAILIDG